MHTAILDARVLVLNKSFVPIRLTSGYDAICKLFTDIAEVVTVSETGAYEQHSFTSWAELSAFKEEFNEDFFDHDDIWVRSPSVSLIVPRVIRLLTYNDVPKQQVRLSRKNIYERDGYTCQYCGVKAKIRELNIDHVVPRSKGGRNSWTNLVCSCIKCNSRKADKSLAESGMKLLKKPSEPKMSFRFRLPEDHKRYRDWEAFVGDMYWNVELQDD
jgi:5-methylcytosine-specific restriction endonuclease McrA